MASITNRSNYVVEVAGEPQLTKRFPFNEHAKAQRYRQKLFNDGKAAEFKQLEDTLLVRIRDKGYPQHTFGARSYEEAENEVLRIMADRTLGRRVDYNKARGITLAQLFDKYITEECPKHKGCRTETYTLNAFLADIGYESQYARKKREQQEHSGRKTRSYKTHRKREGIEWLNLPFADLVPTEFNRYVEARRKQGISAATIDREFDLIAQVINWAIETLRYHVEVHPLLGFKRPKYFNERDRRLRGDEGPRLLDAAREEDRIRSFDIAVEQLVADMQGRESPRPGKSWNKYFLVKARKQIRQKIGRDFLHIPFWEALFEFLLATTSRRSEVLGLMWTNTHLDDQVVFYPDTKNGRSRYVPVRHHVIELLRKLPHGSTDGRVFPITGDQLDGAWERICDRAKITNYHIHDNRHEGLSATAEAGRAAGVPFDVISLAALSGHRDLRMLARYTHLCAGEIAERMDEAFELAQRRKMIRKGRARISSLASSSNNSAGAAAHLSISVEEDADEGQTARDEQPEPGRLM